MVRSASLDDAITTLYDAAIDGGNWHATIEALCRAYRAESGILHLVDVPAGTSILLGWQGFDEKHLYHFSEHYKGLDPWTVASQRLAPGTPLIFTEQVRSAALRRTDVWNDFLVPNRYDIEQGLGAVPTLHDGKLAAFGVHRPHRLADFTRSEARQLGRFNRHLRRALHLSDRWQLLGERIAVANSAFDTLSVGIVLIDEAGRVVLANRAALEQCGGNAGLFVKDSRLGARDPAAHNLLCAAVSAALAQAAGRPSRATDAFQIPRTRGRPLATVVSPLPPRAGDVIRQRPAAIVFIVDPDQRAELAIDALYQLYGLTPAEVRVAELVVGGRSIEAAANVLGVSRNTARNQLQSAYAKTGAARLTDLVAVFTRLSVLLRRF